VIYTKTISPFSTTAFFPDLFEGTYRISVASPQRTPWSKVANVDASQTTAFSFVRLFPEEISSNFRIDGAVTGIAPSPNGSSIAVWSSTALHLYEATTGEILDTGLSNIFLGDIDRIAWLGENRLLVVFESGVSTVVGGLAPNQPAQLVPLSHTYVEVITVSDDRILARTQENEIELILLPDRRESLPVPLLGVRIADNVAAMALHGESVAYLDTSGILWILELDKIEQKQRTVAPLNVEQLEKLVASRHGTGYLAIDTMGGAWLAADQSERFELIAEGIVDAKFSFDNKKLLLIGSREVSLYALEDRIEQPARTQGQRETITRISSAIIDAEFLTPEEEHAIVMTPAGLIILELDLRGGHNSWEAQNISAYTSRNSPAQLYLGDSEGNVSIVPIPIPGLLSQLLL